MRRSRQIGMIFAAALLLAGCGSTAPPSQQEPGGGSPAPSSAPPAVVDRLDGATWRSTFTCDDMSKKLDSAGLHEFAAQVVRQFGDCDGVMHSTLAFADGSLTTTGSDGKTNPPSPYQMVNDHTYVQGFLQNTFRVRGDSLIFVDTQIIAALYPYDPKIIPREQAFDVAVLETAPFERVS